MELTIDFSEFPEEVTDFAFDQLDDLLTGDYGRDEALRTVIASNIGKNYDEQTVSLESTVVTETILGSMSDKIRDIKYEVENDERDDYTVRELEQLMQRLEEF